MSILENNYAVVANMSNDCGLSIVICSADERDSSFNVHMTSMGVKVKSVNVTCYEEALEVATKQLMADHHQ